MPDEGLLDVCNSSFGIDTDRPERGECDSESCESDP
jgi:hypothetical protein